MLDKVEIEDSTNRGRLHFPCGRWSDKCDDTGFFEQDILPIEKGMFLLTTFATIVLCLKG